MSSSDWSAVPQDLKNIITAEQHRWQPFNPKWIDEDLETCVISLSRSCTFLFCSL